MKCIICRSKIGRDESVAKNTLSKEEFKNFTEIQKGRSGLCKDCRFQRLMFDLNNLL